MEESVLDKISPVSYVVYDYNGWRNGKTGSISNVNGDFIYRFIETERGDNGKVYGIHKKIEDNPIVIEGIVGWWLLYRKNRTNRIVSEYKDAKIESLAIREQFDKYTEKRYKQFKDSHRDDPDTLFWDWDYEFYTKHIIPFEMKLNKTTEALFDYISDSDIVLVRKVMNAYIEYLKRCRSDRGFYVSNELKVLRAIEYSDEFMLEDLEDFEVSAILDDLESKGYVKVAWTEGHGFEDVRLLDKGRAYMKQLETGEIKTEDKLLTRHEPQPVNVRKPKNPCPPKQKKDYSRYSFKLNVNNKKLENLYSMLSKRDNTGKRFIDGEMQNFNETTKCLPLGKEEIKLYKSVDIDKMLFNQVFAGIETDVRIVWRGDAVELWYFIYTLYNYMVNDIRLLDKSGSGPGIWQIVRSRFLNGKARKVFDERIGIEVETDEPIEFGEDAFSKYSPKNSLSNPSVLDAIINKIAPPRDKSDKEVIEEDFNQQRYDMKSPSAPEQLGKGFHDTNHKSKY